MKIFITHYSPLKERMAHIKNLLKELNMEGEFIKDFDRELINLNDKRFIQKKITWYKQLKAIKIILIGNILYNKKTNFSRKIYWLFCYILNKFFTPRGFKFRKLSLAEISLTLKHYIALKKIENSNEPGLIIEDDVILKPETKILLKKAFILCKNNFDFIDLGGGCDLPLFKDEKFFKEDNRFFILKIPRSRTTAAYMINPKTASKIANELFPIVMPIDWQYQFIFLKYNFKVLWSLPPAFIHGSIENKDIFKSSIQE